MIASRARSASSTWAVGLGDGAPRLVELVDHRGGFVARRRERVLELLELDAILRQGAVGLGALELEMAELVPSLHELPLHGLELVARLGPVGGSAGFGELGFDGLGVGVERVERAAGGLELGA